MQCSKCNQLLQGNESFCPHCGACVSYTPQTPPSYHCATDVPKSIKKWNWGAFMFNAVWGIGNYNYLPLLCFIPLFNFIWMFVCGIKGNEWAWKSGKFNNLEDFIATQETWNRAGLICFIISIILIVLYVFLFAGLIGLIFSSF